MISNWNTICVGSKPRNVVAPTIGFAVAAAHIAEQAATDNSMDSRVPA